MKVLDEVEGLFKAGRDQESAPSRKLANEELEYGCLCLPMLKIGLNHVELIEIGQQRIIHQPPSHANKQNSSNSTQLREITKLDRRPDVGATAQGSHAAIWVARGCIGAAAVRQPLIPTARL
jgi:hypothetical protein